jgi:hypothetical protein
MDQRAGIHVQLLEKVAFFFVWLLCGFTVLYHAALWLGATLHDLVSISLACAVVITGYQAWAAVRDKGWEPLYSIANLSSSSSYRGLLALGSVGALAAGIALLASKPNNDDVNYLAHAVLSLTQPDQPLLWRYPFAGVVETGRFSFDIFQSYPFFIAALSSLVGVQALDIYHLGIPLLGGLGFVVAWVLLIYRLTGNWGASVVGTLVLVVLAATDGVTQRSIASFGLYRIWQGKVLLLQVVAPLVMLATLDVLEKKEPRHWWRLFALSVAGIGLTSTAQFFLPILAGLVSMSYAIAYRMPRLLPKSFGIAVLMGLYPLPFSLAALQQQVEAESIGLNFASSLADIFRLVYGFPSLTLALAATMLLVLLRLKKYAQLKWLLIWCGLLFVPLSVTPVADTIASYITTKDAFWRLAYASPVILLIGLGAAHAYNSHAWRKTASGFVVLFCVMAIALAGLPLQISPLSRSFVRFPSLDYKLMAESEKISRALTATLSGGTMLAADELARTLPLLSGKFRMAIFRELDAPSVLIADGLDAQSLQLLRAFRFVSGKASDENLSGFQTYLSMGLDYIVVRRGVLSHPKAILLLDQAGYCRHGGDWEGYAVFVQGECNTRQADASAHY